MYYSGPFYDNDGKEIKMGNYVAFNYSGTVKSGVVTKIGSVKFPDNVDTRFYVGPFRRPPEVGETGKCNIEVEHLNGLKTSNIKNSAGILVIKE